MPKRRNYKEKFVRSTQTPTPTMGGKVDWYKTGDQSEFTMNKRDPEEVGLAKADSNTHFACKVGHCDVDPKTGKPIVFKIRGGGRGL